MKREVVITADGSSTIHIPDWNEQYHSKHGAIQEAYHVFIKHGLHHLCSQIKTPLNVTPSVAEKSQNVLNHNNVSILEIGFGTGLNAFITLLEAEKLNLNIDYFGVEGYPVSVNEIEQLNYPKQLQVKKNEAFFYKLHEMSWEEKHDVTLHLSLTKQKKLFNDIDAIETFNLIYFDAFGARVQPELWTESIFKKMHKALIPEGVLVTYSARGSVRRAMQAVGFTVERLPGPPGKREMLRATK
ncbi:tRNA (5-methylaminomethyl-2-thiouridine)(34)-methyltransferase MnmD [Flaviramulus aquimarinus]|uniref:tRNA (5-methylaminomethyl-2-thiouridine)(34)-methyltransferase MnmD n=1 Tax=Flaviramulus aquimarinus TaxID=1170456 RepID=A0ABP9FAX9_9FLAO